MNFFPPRPKPKRKFSSIKTQQNLQCLLIKQFGQYIQNPVLTDLITNIQRPNSSKRKFQHRPTSSNCSSSQKLPLWRISSISKSTAVQKQSLKNQSDPICQSFLPLYQTLPNSLPSITSRNWCIYSMTSQKMLSSLNCQKRIQVASLTKIMNLYTITTILNQNNLIADKIRIVINEWATSMIGTTAGLKKYTILTLQDLIYGMMLPSGNDAAYQIALTGGLILKLAQQNKVQQIYRVEEVQAMQGCRSNIIRYMAMMNTLAQQLQMSNTSWTNPHGLSNKQNKTTLSDLCKLCNKSMQIEFIRKVVSTKQYTCYVQSYFENISHRRNRDRDIGHINFNKNDDILDNNWKSECFGQDRQVLRWQNTNKMLWKGWSGLKTGVTPNAGPCLAATYKWNSESNEGNDEKNRKVKSCQYLVIVANCQSMNKRWEEVEAIVNWAIANQMN